MRGSHGDQQIVKRARELRANLTDAERRLWAHLRNRQFEGLKFVRQFPIGPFFADFACREANLVIEVDGGQHSDAPGDVRRTLFINDAGFAVLRFWNNEVLQDLNAVLTVISEVVAGRPSPGLRFAPATLSRAAGEGKQEEHHGSTR